MRKKHIIRTFLVILAVTGTFFAFSALRGGSQASLDSSCKESLDNCPKQQGGGKIILENLSHQFFSSI